MRMTRAGRRSRRANGARVETKHHPAGELYSRSRQVPSPVSPLLNAPAAFGRTALWICAALVIANVLVFAPLRHYDFVAYDDPDYVTGNPHVRAGLTWQSVSWAFTTGYAANWHPLTWL